MAAESEHLEPKRQRFHGQRAPVGSRHGGRVALSIAILPEVREALKAKAASAGVSIPEYIANAIAQPERIYHTAAAEIAKPLANVSYRLQAIRQAMHRNDDAGVRLHLNAAIRIVSEALLPLGRRHAKDVRDQDDRAVGGWHGSRNRSDCA